MPPVSRRGGHHASAGGIGEAGLEARNTRIRPQQRVQVLRVEGLVLRGRRYGDLLGAGDLGERRVVLVEVGGDVCEVMSRHAVAGCVEPGRVDEMAGGEADRLGLLVHLADEAVAGHDPARESLGGVIAGVEEEPVEQLADREVLARRYTHQARDDLRRRFRDGYHAVQRTRIVGRHHRGHQFGEACGCARSLGVALPQHDARVDGDEVGGLAVDRQRRLRMDREPQRGEIEMVEVRRSCAGRRASVPAGGTRGRRHSPLRPRREG